MIIIDALIFLAREAFGFFFIFYYLLISLAKALLLLLKPLWFLFWFVLAFVRTIFTSTNNQAVWSPDNTSVQFLHMFPILSTLVSVVVVVGIITVTIKALRNDFE